MPNEATERRGIEEGDRVETTGAGRTEDWPGWAATVTRVDGDGTVYARMDAGFAEEEFAPGEVRLVSERCDDCGRRIESDEHFWFTDWKCPSEVYCDACGPEHGFPHPTRDELDRLQ